MRNQRPPPPQIDKKKNKTKQNKEVNHFAKIFFFCAKRFIGKFLIMQTAKLHTYLRISYRRRIFVLNFSNVS